jgi:hypothetical protein
MFTTPLGDPAAQPKLANPADTSAPLGDRARAYLHTNCAQCHRSQGPTAVPLDLRYSSLLSSTAACDVPPTAGDLGLGASARIIAPGNPDVGAGCADEPPRRESDAVARVERHRRGGRR